MAFGHILAGFLGNGFEVGHADAGISFLRIQSLKIWPKPLRLPPKGPGITRHIDIYILVASFYSPRASNDMMNWDS